MNSFISSLATGGVGAAVLKRAKWSWLGYGVAAYVGLRLMRRYGIMERQADQGIKLMERGVKMAKDQVVSRRMM